MNIGDGYSMAYYMSIETTPGNYEAINIKNTTKGNVMFPNDKGYACTLEEIDKFTSEYEDLSSIRYMLYSEGKTSYVNSALSIVFNYEKELQTSKDILFKESKVYLESPDLVVAYITNKFLSFDLNFAKELVFYLPENSSGRGNIEKLVRDISECLEYNLPLEVTSAAFASKSLIYNLDNDGLIRNPNDMDYMKLRNMIVFIADYEKQRLKRKSRIKK